MTRALPSRRTAALLTVVSLVAAGAAACASDDTPDQARSTTSDSASSPAASFPSESDTPTPDASPIEGRWEQVHTCDQLVAALSRFGLAKVAPAIALDYFPDATAKELAAKPDICSGAEPQRHAHFFDAEGNFGSLDAAGQQVDDAAYTLDGDILTIGDDEGGGRFRVSTTGDQLTLEPLITKADKKAALAHPLDFTVAGWQVGVSYGGLRFHRVPCEQWC